MRHFSEISEKKRKEKEEKKIPPSTPPFQKMLRQTKIFFFLPNSENASITFGENINIASSFLNAKF